MITLNDASSRVVQYIFPLLCGVGLGMLFHAPYQIFTKTLRPKELASGTSAFFLVRFTGATVGLVRFMSTAQCLSLTLRSLLQGRYSIVACRSRCPPPSGTLRISILISSTRLSPWICSAK